MRISYCPQCNKAGLRYEDPEGHCHLWVELEYRGKRYCPRCKVWVKPYQVVRTGGWILRRKGKEEEKA